MPVDLLLYIVVAAVLVFWLRNVLGTRHGEERERPNPLEPLSSSSPSRPEMRGRVVDISDAAFPDRELAEDFLGGAECADEEAKQGLLDVFRADRHFSPKAFVEGAREAFPMIVEAFAKGDLQTLRELLSPGVYAAFEQAVEDRQVRGEIVTTEIHAVRSVKVLGARVMDRQAFIKVRFVADETTLTRDRDGALLSGHPDRVVEMNDVWTFFRDLRSADPTWFLYETSDDDVPDHQQAGVPDVKG